MSVLTVAVNEHDHIRGLASAPVVLLEYGDFECPACGMAYPIVKALEAKLGAMLAVAFRHFPLSTVHPHAQRAAEAAEAAGAQRKFWAMHDCLFEHQDALEDTDLVDYAAQLGLDVPRFASDLGSHRYAPKVRADFTSGLRSGVNGTPTFFVNGVRHDGPYDAVSLLLSIQAAAAARKREPARAARAPR